MRAAKNCSMSMTCGTEIALDQAVGDKSHRADVRARLRLRHGSLQRWRSLVTQTGGAPEADAIIPR